MQRLCFFLSAVILVSLLASCRGLSAATEPKTAEESTAPTELNLPTRDSSGSSLNCLSPALMMNAERAAHTATRLQDGSVLIAGGFREEGTREIAIASAEIFSPATQTFTPTGAMNEPRDGQTATLLPDGRVLLVGGWNLTSRSSTAELYDPQTGEFEYTGSLMAPRQGMTATLLKNGQVLIAGGDSAQHTSQLTAELYDPAARTFTPTGALNYGRMAHTATLLMDGSVLLAGGGAGNGEVLASAEIYDPATGQFTLTGEANLRRYKHAAVLLKDGNVLILGGSNEKDWTGKYDSAEIYDVKTSTFTKISSMRQKRFKLPDAAVLLSDGNVLIGGGDRQIEIFDAQSQTFVPAGTLDEDYYYPALTLLQDGQVLITGGYNRNILPSDKAWLYCG